MPQLRPSTAKEISKFFFKWFLHCTLVCYVCNHFMSKEKISMHAIILKCCIAKKCSLSSEASARGSVCSVAQSCPTLCDPMDCSPPDSSVHGILRQEYWSGLPCPPPGDLPNPEIEPTSLTSPALAGGLFIPSLTWEARGSSNIKDH